MAVPTLACRFLTILAATGILATLPAGAQSSAPPADGITRIVKQFEQALATGRPEAFTSALSRGADRTAAEQFVASLTETGVTRVVVREQDRAIGTAAGREAARVVVAALLESGARGRVVTCQLQLQKAPGGDRWEVTGHDVLASLGGLVRLALDSRRGHAARGMVVEAEDLRVQWREGTAFVIEASGQPTGLVLVGKGDVRFAPAPRSEQGQVRIFAGADELQSPVDALYVRFNPGEFELRVKGLGAPQSADARDARRAEELFAEHSAQSYVLELGDLSSDSWSLLPREGDFLAEIGTRRFGTLTYARSVDDAEDISLSDRRARRYIAQYSSRATLASRGPFYDEDSFADYRVTHYDVDVRFIPDRNWINGRATLRLAVTAPTLSTFVVRLADTLTVRSVQAAGLGRVMAWRVRGQDSVFVTLPRTVPRGTELSLSLVYGGPIAAEPPSAEPPPEFGGDRRDGPEIDLEHVYLLSQQVHWYPQPTITSYATAKLRVIVPERYAVVASGEATAPGDPQAVDLKRAGLRPFTFEATQPLRYLACVISPLVRVASEQVRFQEVTRASGATRPEGASYDEMTVTVSTNPREQGRGRALASLSADIVRFYTRLMGDCPYPSLDIALVERELPGGHSPAYMAAINYVFPLIDVTWRNDPATIEGFPEYFVAHEIAHQWWGQAVGGKNYHEQWLSEGFAQYFAALYAEQAHGPGLFQDILRGWQQWAVNQSSQGAVYLGYRVGHIKGDSRVFRAVVYNKGAMVLHMLRRFVGDDAFLRGLRRFYESRRFRKAGTDDLQRAMEAEAHVPLQRFFDRWIRGDTLPQLRMAARVESAGTGQELVVRLEQAGDVFDVPLTVSIDCGGPPVEVDVRLVDARQEIRIPLKGQLRRVDLNRVNAVPLSSLVVADATRATPSSTRPATYRPR